MELVAANYQMSEEGMKAQCEVCAHLRRMFPRSLVILFGSVVSGHAFVTSDCDVCILTDPSPRDMEDFDPTRYYNQQLLRIWYSTLYSGPDLQEAGGTCLPAAPQQQWVTHFQQGAKSSSPLFDVILSCLQSDTRFTRVVPIPFARCPIVRFFYDPSSLHTDVSIDNRQVWKTLLGFRRKLTSHHCTLSTLHPPSLHSSNVSFIHHHSPTTNHPPSHHYNYLTHLPHYLTLHTTTLPHSPSTLPHSSSTLPHYHTHLHTTSLTSTLPHSPSTLPHSPPHYLTHLHTTSLTSTLPHSPPHYLTLHTTSLTFPPITAPHLTLHPSLHSGLGLTTRD